MPLLFDKLKETAFSVVPIYLLVFILHFTIAPLGNEVFTLFSLSTLLVIVGLTLFNIGTENSIEKMGSVVGQRIIQKNHLTFLLVISFSVGFMIAFAEPTLQVLVNQVQDVSSQVIPAFLLLLAISLGTGISVALAMARIVLKIKLTNLLMIIYGLIFILAAIVGHSQPNLIAVSFDMGGVTTGPLTVPFIMALGLGAASHLASGSNQEDSFGAISMALAGPIVAMLFFSLFFLDANIGNSLGSNEMVTLASLGGTIKTEFVNVFFSLSPLIVIFLGLNHFFFKISKREIHDLLKSSILVYVGVSLFLSGVNAGFSTAASVVGQSLASMDSPFWVLVIAFVLGLLVVFAEPAIYVLNRNVEEVSGGYINQRLMMTSLSFSVGLAVLLAVLRTLYGFSIWWYLAPGYGLTFYLMQKTTPLFSGIAFDSGSVCTGPMTATFVSFFVIGVCIAVGGNIMLDAFGLLALVAMTPLIMIQLLGAIYAKKMETRTSDHDWLDEKEETGEKLS